MIQRKIRWNKNEYTLFDKDFEANKEIQLRALEIRTFIFDKSSYKVTLLGQNAPYVVVTFILIVLFIAVYLTSWKNKDFISFENEKNESKEEDIELVDKKIKLEEENE